LKASIKKVCIKNPGKKRNAPESLFTSDKNDLLLDKEINVIVEVIDDADAAFDIISTAFRQGKAVVSASKKMIAEHLPEILQFQKETGLPFLCEAAACASIPVIRNLEEYYDNDLLHGIKAIINGSTNFILTKMFEDKLDYTEALLMAQQLGFAESNPKLDVEGYDAVNKWSILLAHAYGIVEHPDNLVFTGIQNIQLSDAAVAKEKNYDIKLVAQAQKLVSGKVAAYVIPQFVRHDDQLSFVKNEYNGVVIESGFADKQFFYGKGAGSFPTASAVLSDISALRYNYRYEYKKRYYHTPGELTHDFYVKAYVSFNSLKDIVKEDFEWIEEWHGGLERSYLVGVIHFEKLATQQWWKAPGVSLILAPDPVIESIELRNIKKRSLELAGIGN
jgi:homoserine dehydrogenase